MSREFLNVSGLSLDELINHLPRSDRSDSVTSSLQHSRLSIATLPMIQSGKFSFEKPTWKENWKRFLTVSLIISFIIIGSLILLIFSRTHSISSAFSDSSHSQWNDTSALSTYRLPNNCTYSKIFPLLSWNSLLAFNYTYHSKIYKAMADRAMLTFALRHDPFYWCIDGISIKEIDTNRELVQNGDFESFPPTSFIRCRSASSSSTNVFSTSLYPHSGNQSFCDGSVGTASYLSQPIEMEVGRMYLFSFWLRNLGDTPNNALVFISYDWIKKNRRANSFLVALRRSMQC